MSKQGHLFIVSAPSGAGKTSLVKATVAAMSDVSVAVSHTTRSQRPGEADGINYHFVDTGTFEAMIADGGFLEWATVFGNLYGTSHAAIREQLDRGENLILEIDWQGAQQVRKQVADLLPASSIFILPPSLKTLEQRLHHRAQDDAETVAARLKGAREEISHCTEFDYVIINDDFDVAVVDMQAIISHQGEKLRLSAQNERIEALITSLNAGS